MLNGPQTSQCIKSKGQEATLLLDLKDKRCYLAWGHIGQGLICLSKTIVSFNNVNLL